MGAVSSIFVLSLLSMFNPTLVASVTIMMLLPEPRKLLAGFLAGAYISSIGSGLAIALTLHGSAGVDLGRTKLSPFEDLVLGAILLLVARALLSGWATEAKERRQRRKRAKRSSSDPKESLPERLLGRGSPRLTFIAGILLSFPGASYLLALDKIGGLDWSTSSTVFAVVVFCLIEQLFLEAPLVGFSVAPKWTEGAVVRLREWLSRDAVRAGGRVALVLGALLVLRGTLYLVLH